MAEEECPHGLDPSWCTFCRRKAAGELPAGVRRRRPPPPSRPENAAATRRSSLRADRARPRSSAAGPAEALAQLRKVLFHAAPYGAWPSISELGLLTAGRLLADDVRLSAPRSAAIEVVHASGHNISVRDQRAMIRSNIESHLDGMTLREWLDVLNERSFCFARQKELMTFLGRYQDSEGLDVVVFDTGRLLARAKGRVEVATVNPTGPVPWDRCPCRGQATFVPIDGFAGDLATIQEVTVVGGVEPVADLVVRVMRYHPDRTTEVLVA